MSKEDGSVVISTGEDVLLGNSRLPEEAEGVAISPGDGMVTVHSTQLQQQEITIDHGPHMSIDELLKVIKGANGMPVLFVPSSNGRLAAVAVDGLQSLVPANRDNNGSAEKKHEAFRSWLLLLMSLVATVTFTAGLTPPGGFWAADDPANGYVAGMSVMRSKFYTRYLAFYYSNTTAFFTSLMTIGMLAKNINNLQSTDLKRTVFKCTVAICFMSLGGSYISGTWDGESGQLSYPIAVFLMNIAFLFFAGEINIAYMFLPSFVNWIQSRSGSNARNPQ